jgi:trimeric autotransporter adhesin
VAGAYEGLGGSRAGAVSPRELEGRLDSQTLRSEQALRMQLKTVLRSVERCAGALFTLLLWCQATPVAPADPALCPWQSGEASALCTPQWIPAFGPSGGLKGDLRALVDFPGNSEPALYVGGTEIQLDGQPLGNLVRYEAGVWKEVAKANGAIQCLRVIPASALGPATLVVGGIFTQIGGIAANGIAAFDGVGFSAFGAGLLPFGDVGVQALELYRSSAQHAPILYAGGKFQAAPGAPTAHLARLKNGVFEVLPNGPSGEVKSLRSGDLGGGERLYLAGQFTLAGGKVVRNVAAFDGFDFWPLGEGLEKNFAFEPAALVNAIEIHADLGGKRLYATGRFSKSGQSLPKNIGVYDGSAWKPLGSGLDGEGTLLRSIETGPEQGLWVIGSFAYADGVAAQRSALWNQGAFKAFEPGFSTLPSEVLLRKALGGASPQIFVLVWGPGSMVRERLPGMSPTWKLLGTGLWSPGGNDSGVFDVEIVAPGGPLPAGIYVSGLLPQVGDGPFPKLARFTDGTWSAHYPRNPEPFYMGTALEVTTVAGFQGEHLFLANGPGVVSGPHRIEAFDGHGWQALPGACNGFVQDLEAFDSGFGAGPELYAVGDFSMIGGGDYPRIARFDGVGWQSVAGGLTSGGSSTPLSGRCLASYDDGQGLALYAAGRFLSAGGVPALNIARWDGIGWQSLGLGLGVPFSMTDEVRCLEVFDDGAGLRLYAAGTFSAADGLPAANLAAWDGQAWTAIDSPFAANNTRIEALAVHAAGDGRRRSLYVGGFRYSLSTFNGPALAAFDGSQWTFPWGDFTVFGGPSQTVTSLASNPGIGGLVPGLEIGFDAFTAPSGDPFIAHWGCP